MRFFELLSQVPIVHNIPSYIICAFNIILPGVGTCISACLADRYVSNKTQLIVGVFQFLTAYIIFGWIWSIYWGYLIVLYSEGGHREVKQIFGRDTETEAERQAQRG